MRLLDLALKAFQRSHVACPRPSRLEGQLHAAGFDEVAVERLLGGCYAIIRAERAA